VAGAFTHWMVVEKAVDKLPAGDYSTILGQKINFVRIGAVGPDYPYMSELAGNLFKTHSWADRMHYENALEFVQNGLVALFAQAKGSDTFKICLSWLCGYISHLLADAIIHPVVNANVGGTYLFTKHNHRICEMTQDTWIFYEIKGVDLSNAAYISLLTGSSDPTDKNRIHPAIRNFWPGVLRNTHPGGADYFDKINPDKWHEAYVSKLSTASHPMPVFRHIGEEENLVYKTRSEIKNSDEEKKYVTNIKLPNSQTRGNFKEHAFDKTVNKVIEVWQKVFVDINNNNAFNCKNYLGNWNLDTGLNEDAIIFWS